MAKLTICIACAASTALATLLPSLARADEAACVALANQIYPTPAHQQQWDVKVKGTRLTWRGTGGFTSFTMHADYNSDEHGFNTPESATRDWFRINKMASIYRGKFAEVFPGNSEQRSDIWNFEFRPDGKIRLISETWSSEPVELANVDCYPVPNHGLVVTSVGPVVPGWGQNFWTFLIKAELTRLT